MGAKVKTSGAILRTLLVLLVDDSTISGPRPGVASGYWNSLVSLAIPSLSLHLVLGIKN